MILESFQLFLLFVSVILILFYSISLNSHIYPYSILDGTVGTHARAVLDTMLHIISLRYSCLLAKHAIAMGTVVIVRLFLGSLVGEQDTSPCLILPRNPDGLIPVR